MTTTITSLTGGTPTEFEIGGTGEDYIEFGNTFLYLKVKLMRADGTDLQANDVVSPLTSELFSTWIVFTGRHLVKRHTDNHIHEHVYPYRAMFEVLLTYGRDAKRSQLTATLLAFVWLRLRLIISACSQITTTLPLLTYFSNQQSY